MRRPGRLWACTVLVLLLVGGIALPQGAAQSTRQASMQPSTKPAGTPWGKTVDGLACRLTVPASTRIGEPITLVVELKNVSGKKRYLLSQTSFYYGDYAQLRVTGPDGKEFGPSPSGKLQPHPRLLKAMAPGEVWSFAYADVREMFGAGLNPPGRYRLVYSFKSPKPERVKTGIRMVNGQRQDMYAEPSREQVELAWTDEVTSNAAELQIVPLQDKNLIVHEWGVLSVFNDLKYANVEMKQEWASMPEFFYRQFPTRRLTYQPSFARKPILYFYSDLQSLKVEVNVTFPRGAPVVWWPCCSSPVDDGRNQPSPAKVFRSLQWSGWVGQKVPAGNARAPKAAAQWVQVKPHAMPSKSWLTQARIDGPAMFSVPAGRLYPYRPSGSVLETEQFIYYDGLVPAPDYLRCDGLAAESVAVRSSARFDIGDLLLIDRRGWKKGEPVRFAHVKGLAARGSTKAAWRQVPAKDWPTVPAAELRRGLLAAGLFAAEANAVLSIWEGGFFHRGGVTGIYLLPRSEYDRLISLAVDPRPTQTVRVGIVLHCHLEGPQAVVARAKELVAQLEAASYRIRERATRDLSELGPAALPVLRQALADTVSAEARTRLRQILDGLDASEYLRQEK